MKEGFTVVTDTASSTQFLVCTINWEFWLLVVGYSGHYIGEFFRTSQQVTAAPNPYKIQKP